jgi:hypothetical protein
MIDALPYIAGAIAIILAGAVFGYMLLRAAPRDDADDELSRGIKRDLLEDLRKSGLI